MHLALGKRSRIRQLDYITEITNTYKHVIVMGDMNCRPDSSEIKRLHAKAGLSGLTHDLHTFPSWRPERNIDQILVSSSLKVERTQVLNHTFSDHLPVSMEIELPEGVRLIAS